MSAQNVGDALTAHLIEQEARVAGLRVDLDDVATSTGDALNGIAAALAALPQADVLLSGRIDALAARVAKLEAPVVPPPVPPPTPPPVVPPPVTPPVTPPPVVPPSGGLAFASDFKNGVADGGKWTVLSAQGDRLAIVPAPANFPTATALAIRYDANDQWQGITARGKDGSDNAWPTPAIGQKFARRLYVYFELDGTGGGFHHPIECRSGNDAYAAEWFFDRGSNPDTFLLSFAQIGHASEKDNHEWTVELPRRQTLCIEEQYERVGQTTFAFDARITAASGKVWGGTAIVDRRGSPGASIAQYAALGGRVILTNPDALRALLIQNQGVGALRGSANLAANRIYYGAVAVSLNGFVGPYVPGEAG